MGSLNRVKDVANIVSSTAEDRVVVLSAMSGVTNTLIRCGQEAAKGGDFLTLYGQIKEKYFSLLSGLEGNFRARTEERLNVLFMELLEVLDAVKALKFIDPRVNDLVVSFGERLMCAAFPFFLRVLGRDACEVDARQLIFTDNDFSKARVNFKETNAKIQEWKKAVKGIPVVTGFIASTKDGSTTTLSRGGSDYTATIIGGALGAERVEIWTDVDGAMTADPRVVEGARVLERLTYAEAAEMAYFGAKVLHPKTIEPVVVKEIPARVVNTFNHKHRGTLITGESQKNIKSVSSKNGSYIINLYSTEMLGTSGFMAEIFSIFLKHDVVIDVVSTSESSISVTTECEPTTLLIKDLEKYYSQKQKESQKQTKKTKCS